MGSDHAQWAKVLMRFSSLFRKTNSEIVRVLEPGSEMLANLQQEFHTMLDDRARNHGKELEIFCFYEELAMIGVGEVGLYPSIPFSCKGRYEPKQIVPRHSAILPRYRYQGIHATHTDMTKFSSRSDPDYDRVSGELYMWCRDLPTQTSVHEVRNKRVEKFGQVHTPSQQVAGNVNTAGGNSVHGITYGNVTF